MQILFVCPPRSQITTPGSTLSSDILAHFGFFLHHVIVVTTFRMVVVVLCDPSLSLLALRAGIRDLPLCVDRLA